MFGKKGFYISASGAIQGNHGPLVNLDLSSAGKCCKMINKIMTQHPDTTKVSDDTTRSRVLTTPRKKTLEKILGKGDNSCKRLIPLFLYFPPYQRKLLHLSNSEIVVLKCVHVGRG